MGENHNESEQKSKAQTKLEKRLKIWLENTPIYLQLQWFDVIEGIEISSKLKTVRWSTETKVNPFKQNSLAKKLGINILDGKKLF